jgi:hypothetical protein
LNSQPRHRRSFAGWVIVMELLYHKGRDVGQAAKMGLFRKKTFWRVAMVRFWF